MNTTVHHAPPSNPAHLAHFALAPACIAGMQLGDIALPEPVPGVRVAVTPGHDGECEWLTVSVFEQSTTFEVIGKLGVCSMTAERVVITASRYTEVEALSEAHRIAVMRNVSSDRRDIDQLIVRQLADMIAAAVDREAAAVDFGDPFDVTKPRDSTSQILAIGSHGGIK